jgi:Flavodoxin
MTGSRVLVAYFSRSGNTRVVAGLLQRAFKADRFEIRPANPYPEEYLATVEQARQERDSRFEPALAARPSDIGTYDTVYLGFPIGEETAPPVVRSFLVGDPRPHGQDAHAFRNPWWIRPRQQPVHARQPRAAGKDKQPFVMEAEQERGTMNLVNEWLDETGLNKLSGVPRADLTPPSTFNMKD